MTEQIQCCGQFLRIEIRPEGVGEMQFGIGKIPQQKIGDTPFTAGTDQEIRRRQPGQGPMPVDQGFVDIGRIEIAGSLTLWPMRRTACTMSHWPP